MPSAHAVRCSSIVDTTYKPTVLHRVKVEAIETIRQRLRPIGRHDKTNFEIPFILLPGIFAPPFAGTAPWSGSRHHVAPHPAKRNAHGAAFTQFDDGGRCRTEGTEPGDRRSRWSVVLQWLRSRGIARWDEPPHLKCIWAMCIEQMGRSDIGITNEIREAREGQLEFL